MFLKSKREKLLEEERKLYSKGKTQLEITLDRMRRRFIDFDDITYITGKTWFLSTIFYFKTKNEECQEKIIKELKESYNELGYIKKNGNILEIMMLEYGRINSDEVFRKVLSGTHNDFSNIVNKSSFRNKMKESNLMLYIGFDMEYEDLFLDLKEESLVLINGDCISGKSNLIRNSIINLMLNNTPEDLQILVGGTQEGIEYEEFEGNSFFKDFGISKKFIDDIGNLGLIMKELDRRKEILKKNNIKSIYELSKEERRKSGIKDIVVFYDDFNEIKHTSASYEQTDFLKIFKESLKEILKFQKQLGVYFFISSQLKIANDGFQFLEKGKMIAGKMSYYRDYEVALGKEIGYTYLRGLGDFLIKDGDEVKRLQSHFMKKEFQNMIIKEINGRFGTFNESREERSNRLKEGIRFIKENN